MKDRHPPRAKPAANSKRHQGVWTVRFQILQHATRDLALAHDDFVCTERCQILDLGV